MEPRQQSRLASPRVRAPRRNPETGARSQPDLPGGTCALRDRSRLARLPMDRLSRRGPVHHCFFTKREGSGPADRMRVQLYTDPPPRLPDRRAEGRVLS